MIDTFQLDLPHGVTLSCRAAGARGQPVLVFLHGFPEAAFVWDAMLAHFSRPENGGYRCVAPNLRGFEKSSAPADVSAYRAKFLIQDLAALIAIESPGAPLACLVAHDWGGALAWTLAIKRPDLLDRLVIINNALRVDVPTLVIWGMDGKALLSGCLDGLERWAPGVETHRVPGASRRIIHEEPEFVSSLIADWLDRGLSTAGEQNKRPVTGAEPSHGSHV